MIWSCLYEACYPYMRSVKVILGVIFSGLWSAFSKVAD